MEGDFSFIYIFSLIDDKKCATVGNSMSVNSLRRVKAIIIKEFLQIVRDPSSILISIILPLILLFIYGFGVSLDINHLRLALVMEDTSPDAQSFARSFLDSPYFDVSLGR